MFRRHARTTCERFRGHPKRRGRAVQRRAGGSSARSTTAGESMAYLATTHAPTHPPDVVSAFAYARHRAREARASIFDLQATRKKLVCGRGCCGPTSTPRSTQVARACVYLARTLSQPREASRARCTGAGRKAVSAKHDDDEPISDVPGASPRPHTSARPRFRTRVHAIPLARSASVDLGSWAGRREDRPCPCSLQSEVSATKHPRRGCMCLPCTKGFGATRSVAGALLMGGLEVVSGLHDEQRGRGVPGAFPCLPMPYAHPSLTRVACRTCARGAIVTFPHSGTPPANVARRGPLRRNLVRSTVRVLRVPMRTVHGRSRGAAKRAGRAVQGQASRSSSSRSTTSDTPAYLAHARGSQHASDTGNMLARASDCAHGAQS